MPDLWKGNTFAEHGTCGMHGQIMHEHHRCSDSAVGKLAWLSAMPGCWIPIVLTTQPKLSARDSKPCGSAQIYMLAHDACSFALSLALSEEAKISRFGFMRGVPVSVIPRQHLYTS